MRHHLAFCGLAQTIALDGVRQDDSGLALVRHSCGIGRIDLLRIVAATVQTPDVVIGQMRHQCLEFGMLAEEMFARIGATLGLKRLELTIDGAFHDAAQHAIGVLGQQRIPAVAPQHLDDIPAGTEEGRLELLNDLAVTTHRAVETLQVAVDDEHQVVEAFAHRHGERAHRLGFVHLAVAAKRPDLAIGRCGQAAVFHVAQKARLVDRHHRPQTHGHRRELPEVRHQPRVRIRRQTTAADFLAEAAQMLFAQPAFQEGASIDAGRTVALHEDHVAGVLVGRAAPEVVKAHFIERGRGGIAGQVTAVFGRHLVGLRDHGHSVPAHVRLKALFDGTVTRIRRLLSRGNRVDVGRLRLVRQIGTGAARMVDESLEQEVGTVGSAGTQHRVNRL